MTGPGVLIVGGSGLAGGYIAAALLDNPEASVVLGARDEGRLKPAAAKLEQHGTDRVSTVVVDAADPDSLKRAAAGADLVVLAAQAKQYGAAIGWAALDAGADVIDITMSSGGHHPMEALRQTAEESGRCLVTDAGMLPGLPAVLVRLAAGRLDRLDTAFVGAALSSEAGWPEDTVAEIVEDLAHPPVFVWRDGAWRKSRMAGMADRRKFDFGREWGRRTCAPLLVEEMRALPKLYPSLKEAGSFIAGNAFVDSVALPLAAIVMRVGAPTRASSSLPACWLGDATVRPSTLWWRAESRRNRRTQRHTDRRIGDGQPPERISGHRTCRSSVRRPVVRRSRYTSTHAWPTPDGHDRRTRTIHARPHQPRLHTQLAHAPERRRARPKRPAFHRSAVASRWGRTIVQTWGPPSGTSTSATVNRDQGRSGRSRSRTFPALGRPVVGMRSDLRVSGDNEATLVNLQVEWFILESGGSLAQSLEEALEELCSVVVAGRRRNSGRSRQE